MAPIREYYNWNIRLSDNEEPIEPFRKYYFICEGANTEAWYFRKLIDYKKQLGIHSSIDIRLLERTAEDLNVSAPKRLIEYAETQKISGDISYDINRDKMVIVFDVDIFDRNKETTEKYKEILAKTEQSLDNIVGVTNPSFELFLLLHEKGSYKRIIQPNSDEILKNQKIGKKRYIATLLSNELHINSKENPEIGNLALQADIAIEQEKYINQDIHDCFGKLTSNIGKIIDEIRKDEGIF